MKKDKIGAILKNRISEMGYTQELFAEKAGIGLSSLKKYMSGENVYNIELLEKFSELLECSFDYLLGKSLSPNSEYKSAKEVLRLSDKTIEKLGNIAREYDENIGKRNFIKAVDELIESDYFVEYVAEFFWSGRQLNEVMGFIMESIGKNSAIEDYGLPLRMEDSLLIFIISELGNMRSKVLERDREKIKEIIKIN